jgi:hypothetical protein
MLKGPNNSATHKSKSGMVAAHLVLIREVLDWILVCIIFFLLFSFYFEKPK